MKIKLWGVRGSIPTTGPETKHYGGNTSCVEVTEDGWILILDAGSGMQRLNTGADFSGKRVDILLTHLHFDHIQGLGFFKALFDPSAEVHIWGPASSTQSLRSRIGRYFSPPLFPVHFRELPCQLTLHEIENSSFEIGPFQIESRFVTHLGPTVGYRICDHYSSFSYIPDHEPALGAKGMIPDRKWLSGSDLALEADLLLHDAQYTAEEYQNRIGWGHCSMEDAAKYAALTGAKYLLLAHHDPAHSDAQLNQLFVQMQEQHNYPFKCELAMEGMEVELA
ncbi:MAG: MBL fold metallo-hydrolase [Flavisolibacter sp.]|nr:MBL fold metallo-hydrolase [Flavisolibacter sp.]